VQKTLNLFKEFFQPFENIAILHINNHLDFLNEVIDDVAQEYNGSVKTIVFNEEKDAKLNGVAREYEYIVLSDILSHCSHADKIIALMYKALENSANIIIVEKKSHHNEETIKHLLDKATFVAINTTDLFEEYHVITARKLHMWGSGL
jgi:predicted nicotinamide N-methyase